MLINLTPEFRQMLTEIMASGDYEQELDAIEVGIRLLHRQIQLRNSIRDIANNADPEQWIEMDEFFWDDLYEEVDEMDEAEDRRIHLIKDLEEIRLSEEKGATLVVPEQIWQMIEREAAVIAKFGLPTSHDIHPPSLRR